MVEAHHLPMLVASHWQEQEALVEVRKISGGMMIFLHHGEESCREVSIVPASHSDKKEMAEACT